MTFDDTRCTNMDDYMELNQRNKRSIIQQLLNLLNHYCLKINLLYFSIVLRYKVILSSYTLIHVLIKLCIVIIEWIH